MKSIAYLVYIFFLIFAGSAWCYPFSLPGDKNWPTPLNFLDFKKRISGQVSFRGDSDYAPHTWNRLTNTPKPAVIVKPISSNDVIEALKFALTHNIKLSVQSTGHHQDYRNIADNSVHLDMSTMNAKSIDKEKRTLTVGPGNNWRQIHSFVQSQTNSTLIAMSGADPGVGIYGWTVGGGHGALTRQYGLGVDALLSIDLVLANLTIVTASETQNAELFRAIRGSGGGTYGIALSLTVKLYENPGVMSTFGGVYALNNQTAAMFANWMLNAPNRAVGYFLPRNLGPSSKFITIDAYCFGNTSFCTPVLSPLQVGCLPIAELNVDCNPKYEAYSNFYEFFGGPSDSGGVLYLSSTAFNATNILSALQDVITFIDQNEYTFCSGNSVLGGVSSTIDLNQEKTSVALEMRSSLMAMSCAAVMDDSVSTSYRKAGVDLMDQFAEKTLKKYSKWVFWNEAQHNFPSNDWQERYWGGKNNYNRLLAVKKLYDPNNIFTCYHCIGYEKIEDELPAVCPFDRCSCSNTPDGQCSKLPGIQWGNIAYRCNFDEANSSSACNAKFVSNSNGQQVGLFDTSNTISTQLGFDLTDLTSIYSLTASNQSCQIPYKYNSKSKNFCTKISNSYQCQTIKGYSNCNLGKFFGIRTTTPSDLFNVEWETNSFISLPRAGNLSLQFYAFYNCYQTKGLFDFFASDCSDVSDRLTVYSKSSVSQLYSVAFQINLGKNTPLDSWKLFNINLNTTSTELFVKIRFERLTGASKGEALFGLDELTLLDQNIF